MVLSVFVSVFRYNSVRVQHLSLKNVSKRAAIFLTACIYYNYDNENKLNLYFKLITLIGFYYIIMDFIVWHDTQKERKWRGEEVSVSSTLEFEYNEMGGNTTEN